jgi:hypothetical protein
VDLLKLRNGGKEFMFDCFNQYAFPSWSLGTRKGYFTVSGDWERGKRVSTSIMGIKNSKRL